MEYIYATLTLTEAGQEINQQNLTAVLEAADVDVEESRVKGIVAALEDVPVEEIGAEAGIAPEPSVGTGPADETVDDEDPDTTVEAETETEDETEPEEPVGVERVLAVDGDAPDDGEGEVRADGEE